MTFFNEKKNLFFNITLKLLGSSKASYTKQEINEAFQESGFIDYNYDFVSALIGERNTKFTNITLFAENEKKYSSIISSKMPIILSNLEKEWLVDMLQDSNISSFISETLICKLENMFQINHVSRTEPNDKITKILEALRNNKMIICNNKTQYGDLYANTELVPCKLEYSLRQKTFWLIGLIPKEDHMVKISIDRMTIIELRDNNLSIDLNSKFEDQREPSPIVLEIKDEKGALERALHSFSSYKKDGIYSKERNVHIIKIFYYRFDEYELIKDIISLGRYVKVIEPVAIKQQIINTLKRQIDLIN